MNSSKVIKCNNYQWKEVPAKEYKTDSNTFKGVRRYSLLGERDDEQRLNFQTRYFEVEPGGYTSFEYHRHPHSVVVIRGSGRVIIGEEVHELGLHDVIYITPETPHQFQATDDEPLGFLCIVDRYRDKPVLPDPNYIKEKIHSANVKDQIRGGG